MKYDSKYIPKVNDALYRPLPDQTPDNYRVPLKDDYTDNLFRYKPNKNIKFFGDMNYEI